MSIVEPKENNDAVKAFVIGPWNDKRAMVSFTGFPLIEVETHLGEVSPKKKRKRMTDSEYAYQFVAMVDAVLKNESVKLILVTDLSAQSLRFWHKTDMGFYKSKYKLRFAVLELDNKVVRYMSWL